MELNDPPIGPAWVHLWYATPADVDVPATRDACAALLTTEERARQAAWVFERNRREFLATRVLVRRVLSSYVAVGPETWSFARNAHGKPAIDPVFARSAGGAASRLRFNLSNTADLVVCLVSDTYDVGVDVEPVARAGQVLEVAHTVFTASERAELASLDTALRRQRAVELWTLKESYMKARGLGFALTPDSFAIDGASLAREPWVGDPASWRFDVRLLEEHVVATCVEASSDLPIRVDVRRGRL